MIIFNFFWINYTFNLLRCSNIFLSIFIRNLFLNFYDILGRFKQIIFFIRGVYLLFNLLIFPDRFLDISSFKKFYMFFNFSFLFVTIFIRSRTRSTTCNIIKRVSVDFIKNLKIIVINEKSYFSFKKFLRLSLLKLRVSQIFLVWMLSY